MWKKEENSSRKQLLLTMYNTMHKLLDVLTIQLWEMYFGNHFIPNSESNNFFSMEIIDAPRYFHNCF